jgi:hypothetical protein
MIDVHHNADLMVSFIHIALVDTLWVYPEYALPPAVPESLQACPQIFGDWDLKGLVIE